jgi:hypothetical protein
MLSITVTYFRYIAEVRLRTVLQVSPSAIQIREKK